MNLSLRRGAWASALGELQDRRARTPKFENKCPLPGVLVKPVFGSSVSKHLARAWPSVHVDAHLLGWANSSNFGSAFLPLVLLTDSWSSQPPPHFFQSECISTWPLWLALGPRSDLWGWPFPHGAASWCVLVNPWLPSF